MRNQKPRSADSAGVSDEVKFWDSFYSANQCDELEDWQTIGPIACGPEIRFHYNATENSIISALAKLFPFPPVRRLYAQGQAQKRWRVLDIGSGAGHWVDFYRTYYHADVVAIEMTARMVDMLSAKYGDENVLQADITQPFTTSPADIVNAIGVMFHIVEDSRWEAAIGNLASSLKVGGYMLVGGQFGDKTEDVQFHKTDHFSTWSEHDLTRSPANLVNKRLRALKDWERAAEIHDLVVVDLIYTDVPNEIRTPENNLLVLQKIAAD